MARKITIPEVENETSKLFELISNWGENKSNADKLKKIVDADASEIKQIMIQEGIETQSSGKYTACLSYQHKESFNEEALINYLKNIHADNCIKTVEVIDWDAFEKAAYNGNITKEQMIEIDKFKTVTKTPILKLKIQKEG